MPDDPLQPDPDSLTKWRELPQNQPSKRAYPPVTGGSRWAWGLLLILAVVVIVSLLAQPHIP